MSIQANNPVRRAALPSLVAAAVAAALLTGCSYRMDRTENPVKMPAAWDAASITATTPQADAAIPKEWWKNFNSPVLNALIEEAARSYPTIISSEERLKQAERTFGQAHDRLFPDLTVQGSTSRSTGGGTGRDTTTSGSTSLSLGTSYTVDVWGTAAATYRSSVATYINSKWDAELARINMAATVSRAYFNLLNARSNLAVARQNLETTERVQRILDARYREGLTSELDRLQQATQVTTAQTSLITAETGVRRSETALGLLLGRTPQEYHLEESEPISQLTVPEIAPWLPGELLLRRPDIASEESTLVQARANLVSARAQLIPITLGALSANVSTNSPQLLTLTDTRSFSLSTGAISIATGIFNYRGRRNAYLTAKSNEFLALVNYAQTIRTALKEVDDTLADVDAARRTEESQQLSLEQAQRQLSLAELQLREGTGQTETLLTAQRALFQAQESLQRQRVARLTSAVALYVSLGGGWEGPSEADLALMQPKKAELASNQPKK